MRALGCVAAAGLGAVALAAACGVDNAAAPLRESEVVAPPLDAREAVSIPGVATQPVVLRSGSGMKLGVSWVGAADVAGVIAQGSAAGPGARSTRARYAGAIGGADLEVAWSDDAFEDTIHFAARPAAPVVRYALDLEGVAGLRLVDDVLELLDEGGAPQLRMGRAHVEGASGERVRARTTIEDCAYSGDPRAPWGEPVVPPGRARCTVAVRWEDETLTYPATLDPLWGPTYDLAEARIDLLDQVRPILVEGGAHAGKVFVAGGSRLYFADAASLLDSAELFDPATKKWTTLAPLPAPRRGAIYAYVDAPSGPGILIAGGCTVPCDSQATSWIYDLATGTYLPVGDLGSPRSAAFVMRMPDGHVLVTGGGGKSGQPLPYTTEIFDPATGQWSFKAPRDAGRVFGASAVLADGRFLIGGGRIQPNVPISTAEIYDPVADTWMGIGDMNIERWYFDYVTLDDGRVIGVGGLLQTAFLSEVELFDPTHPSPHFALTGELLEGTRGHVAVKLSNGFVAAVGNFSSGVIQLFDPAKDEWSYGTPLPDPWWEMGATHLADGRVLLVGGVVDGSPPAATTKTMILAPAAHGTACVADGECASKHCVDGFCCNDACDGACTACSAAKKGAGEDGVCGAAITGTEDLRCGDESASCGAIGICAEGGSCALVEAGESCLSCPVNQIGACDGAGVCVCMGAHCVDEHTLQTTNGPTIDCGPYLCAEDDCRHSCNTSTECAAGWVCDAAHQCVFAGDPSTPPPGTPPPAAEGCDCEVGRLPGAGAGRWLVGAALVLVAAARRGRRGEPRARGAAPP